MIFYHRTTAANAARILSGGFKDRTASIPEAIDRTGKVLSQKNGDKPLSKQEIVDETLKNGDPKWSRGSIMPDDFCYNRKNKGSRPDELCVFVAINPEKSGDHTCTKERATFIPALCSNPGPKNPPLSIGQILVEYRWVTNE
jgi:hypothetical protein